MTLRLGHKKRPPFLFSHRARAFNLPCDPKINTRGSTPFYYPEFVMFPGPQEIAVTGDNSFETLFGATWALLFCDNNDIYVLQWNGDSWDVITEQLPAFPEFDGSERAFTAAFDQSARFIYAYEKAGVIKVTRWDDASGTYKQNVNVTGVDPRLLNDASLRFLVPDSDVILFYVDTERAGIKYRVQREIYGTEHDLEYDGGSAVTFPEGVVLDQAQALPYRFELLVSHATGVKRSLAVVSDYYPIPAPDRMTASMAPLDGSYTQLSFKQLDEDPLDISAAPAEGAYTASLIRVDANEPLDVTAAPGEGAYTLTTYTATEAEELDVTAAPGDGAYVYASFKALGENHLSIAAAPGQGAYRATS